MKTDFEKLNNYFIFNRVEFDENDAKIKIIKATRKNTSLKTRSNRFSHKHKNTCLHFVWLPMYIYTRCIVRIKIALNDNIIY